MGVAACRAQAPGLGVQGAMTWWQVTRSEGEGDGKVELSLITDGSGAGRGGDKQADALPPLMPGLPARRGGSQ